MMRRLILLACMTLSACVEDPAGADSKWIIPLPLDVKTGSAEPNLVVGPDNQVVLSWQTAGTPDSLDGKGIEQTELHYAILTAAAWGPAQQVTAGDDWFVNWADFPSVTPITPQFWVAHWLAKSASATYAYDVALAVSNDGGDTWGERITPHTDNTPTEHGFVSVLPHAAGAQIIWLDGRHGVMSLRTALLGPDGSISAGQELDGRVCDCCQTDATLASSGALVVYRDRTAEETRDISLTRAISNNGVAQWQPGKAVSEDGWVIDGCPVNGPAIAARGNQVVVAWFTAANNTPRVRLARSIDAGASFNDAIDIDATSNNPLGRVDVVLLADGAAVVSWLRPVVEADSEQAELCLQGVATDGALGPVQVIARTGAGRHSGFPQMVSANGGLILAWTDTTGAATSIRSARVDVDDIFGSAGSNFR